MQSLQVHSIDLFSHIPCNEINLPIGYQSISKPETQGSLHLNNRFFILEQIGEVRHVTIYSEKINVFNLTFYPDAKSNLPVYATEFVILSDKPVVAVIDAKCLLDTPLSNNVRTILNSARKELEFNVNECDSNWFEQSKSGYEIFIRPQSVHQLSTLFDTHLHVWKNIIQLFENKQVAIQETIDIHKAKINAYKQHHLTNYPGIPLLRRSFGAEWTTTYLEQFLFS
jgi:hypothetical protein